MLLALLALVALASRGHRPLSGEQPAREPSTVFWDYLFSVAVAAYLLGGVALAWVFAVRRRYAPARGSKRGARYVLVFVAAVVLGVALADRLSELPGSGGSGRPDGPSPTTVGQTSPSGGQPYEPQFRWLPLVVIAGAGAVTAAYLAARRRRRRPRRPIAGEELVEELAGLVDDTLDDLRAEPDARRAVIAAYARMERALAAYGLPRRPFEAPLEYLERVAPHLHELDRSAGGLVFELTHLFERAKFSPHAVEREMKEDAIAALAALRDDLRGAAA